MAQILHKCARTTEAVRTAIQKSEKSIMKLAKEYGINPNTVAKWKNRDYVHDTQMGPKEARSTSLSREEEAIIVAFRKHSLLPLDDCLNTLKSSIPHLTRSSLYRCLKRNGMNKLPTTEEEQKPKKKFKSYPIGYFHIDITEVRTEEGKLQLFVAIDRVSKFSYVELHKDKTQETTVKFLHNLVKNMFYDIHTILTDNGAQFTNFISTKKTPEHIFDLACKEYKIEHRLTKPNHPWTNGQVERMNRTIKEATTLKYYYDSHEQLGKHLYDFLNVYNYAKKLKVLKGLTPYEEIIKWWEKDPKKFKRKPTYHTLEPYNYPGTP